MINRAPQPEQPSAPGATNLDETFTIVRMPANGVGHGPGTAEGSQECPPTQVLETLCPTEEPEKEQGDGGVQPESLVPAVAAVLSLGVVEATPTENSVEPMATAATVVPSGIPALGPCTSRPPSAQAPIPGVRAAAVEEGKNHLGRRATRKRFAARSGLGLTSAAAAPPAGSTAVDEAHDGRSTVPRTQDAAANTSNTCNGHHTAPQPSQKRYVTFRLDLSSHLCNTTPVSSSPSWAPVILTCMAASYSPTNDPKSEYSSACSNVWELLPSFQC